MESEIADDFATGYFDVDSSSDTYIIGLAGVLDATGNDQVAQKLLEIQGAGGGWSGGNPEGSVQDTAYAVKALIKANDASNDAAIADGIEWLENNQDEITGGWKNDKKIENTELTGEAAKAVSDYFLKNKTMKSVKSIQKIAPEVKLTGQVIYVIPIKHSVDVVTPY